MGRLIGFVMFLVIIWVWAFIIHTHPQMVWWMYPAAITTAPLLLVAGVFVSLGE
jgi:hypothetical protein